ncbi:MAG: deoxyribodipyrimidine photo-lyase [Bacteroidia bacterium]|nr:MAG: deoxyribodipyrimidine photo-lyase [Bacteroidia bacterium]
MAAKAILWFRNNLRLNDNRCLHYATVNNISVLPLYIIDERLDELVISNIPRCGEKRKAWILANIVSLQKDLQKLGAELYINKGNVVTTLLDVIQRTGISTVFTNYEPGFEEEQDIQKLQQYTNNKIHVINDNFLIHPNRAPFTLNQTPLVFTDFRIQIEKNYKEENFYSDLLPNFICNNSIKSDFVCCSNNESFFEPGEQGALNRVHYYLFESKLVSTYKETRNQLLGTDFSSHFSPWLALGVLSPQTILRYLRNYEKDFGANESTYWLWFELLWRDFFRYQMMKFGKLFFRKTGIRDRKIDSPQNQLLFKQWINGTTSEPFVNANMIELKQTGFMSNRGRQNVASYLIHDLNIDWRWGAAYFEMQLLDYDVSSNWGNWAYIAGVGNDPRPFRKFNIKKQQEQYDPECKFTNYWLNNN